MGNAGTAIRPLTAALALMGGDCCPACRACTSGPMAIWAMRSMPWAPASATWGSRAIRRCLSVGEIIAGAVTRVQGSVSSQFLTALLLAAPIEAGAAASR